MHIGWEFTAAYHFLLLQVIWAIGWSMIGLAVLVFLPPRVVALIGIAIIAGHNLLDPVEGGVLFTLAFGHRRYQLDPQHLVVVGYAVIPWLGVMAAGYGFGELLERPDRRRWVAGLGVALTLAFIALRLVNRYGDPEAWSRQSSPLFTVFSFVNCTKYPPSLDYVLMTLGPALMLLSLLERVEWKPIEIFGRVPLFYYVLHIYLLHAIGLIPALLHHGMGVLPMGVFGVPSDGGIGLPATYAIWIAAVLALYPLCRWYAGFKSRRRDLVWLSYL